MTMYARVSRITPEQLFLWRDRLGFSKYDAAYLLGVSYRSYAAYEGGETPISKAIALSCWAIEEMCKKDLNPTYDKTKVKIDKMLDGL